MFALIASASRSGGRAQIVTAGPAAAYPVVRMRPAQETHLHVLSGTCDVLVDGGCRTLVAGEEAVVPPRTAYRLTSLDDARVARRYRPER